MEHRAWPSLWFIHEVQWGRPLMSMNYVKATLFWIIPHFRKYFPTLPRQVVIIVEGCGTMTHGQIVYHKRQKWKGTQMVSTDEKAQGCYCISDTFAHFLNQFECFLFFYALNFIWCNKLFHKRRCLFLFANGWRRISSCKKSLLITVGWCHPSTCSKWLANTSIYWYFF